MRIRNIENNFGKEERSKWREQRFTVSFRKTGFTAAGTDLHMAILTVKETQKLLNDQGKD